MSLGHEHGLVLIGLAGPMDIVNLSLSRGSPGQLSSLEIRNSLEAMGQASQAYSRQLSRVASALKAGCRER